MARKSMFAEAWAERFPHLPPVKVLNEPDDYEDASAELVFTPERKDDESGTEDAE